MQIFSVNLRKEATEYGFEPVLKLFLSDGDEARPMVIIAPGGGYVKVCDDSEKVALQYIAAGFHAAILNYSTSPHHFPEPQYDLWSAIKKVRENSSKWRVHPEEIAVCGFSAGGHLCASVATLWNNRELFSQEDIDLGLHKPNACILYWAILTAKLGHCKAFLKDHAGDINLHLAACDTQVNEGTPPTFLYGTNEDKLTNNENILYYGEMLSKFNVPFEMHILPKGGHCAPWCHETIWAKPSKSRDYGTVRLSAEWLIELFDL